TNVIKIVRLQDVGKTTTRGKLANRLTNQHNLKPLLVARDVYRPAAIQQLQALGEQLDMPVFDQWTDVNPVDIAKNSLEYAKENHHDYILIDTAGRLHVDDNLMNELDEIKEALNPEEVFLVVDSMTGQDAVNVAESFNERLEDRK